MTDTTSSPKVQPSTPKRAKLGTADLLKAGVQFGHETKRWNPKMKKYIFAEKGNIHIIDISKTLEKLEGVINFIQSMSATGDVLFVGTKRQASDIVKQEAIKAGSYYIINRWPGGLLTNFEQIKQSLKKFHTLEQEFKTGVEGRTKFEVSTMKKEWVKMNRLYEGIKTMNGYPKAIVVIDINYERNVITEAKKLGIPVVAIVDTNTNPDLVDYPIPGNDDAISSIKLLLGVISDAVLRGNKGQGVKHEYIDYSKYEVKILKTEEKKEDLVEVGASARTPVKESKQEERPSKGRSRGILENIQKQKESRIHAKGLKENK